MRRQDKENLRAAFVARYPVVPTRATVRLWLLDVQWLLNLSPGNLKQAYIVINQEMLRVFGVRLI